MRSQTCLYGKRSAWFSCLSFSSTKSSSQDIGSTGGWSRAPQRLVAVAMAFVLLPLAQVEVFAQQGPWQGAPQSGPYPQNQYQYPQNGPYGGQYAPGQQPGYGQPNYAQPGNTQQPDAGPPYPDAGPGYEQPGYGPGQPAAQAFTAEQLEEMLAPIALYPDALLAQVLAAATYPAQVSTADQWLRTRGYASPNQIAAGADAQNWDPSVKALTAFPQVLAQMDQDLAWTTDLGNAYFNQPQDVLQTVQVLRQRANAAGTLQNTPQEQMTYDQGNIELSPPNPQMVYVPQYNPWAAYGQPVQPYPGFSLLGGLGSFLGSSPIQFGLGIAMAAFTHTGFGWLSWALDWLGNSILFNHSNYSSQSTSVARWGSSRGGGSWAGGMRQRESFGQAGFGQSRGNYGRQGNEYRGSNGEGERGFQRPPDNYRGSSAFRNNWPAESNGRGYNTGPEYQNGYESRSGPRYGTGSGNRYGNGYGSSIRPGYQNYAYSRPPLRPQALMPTRPQQPYSSNSYARQSYGSGFFGQPRQGFGSRPPVGDYGQRAYTEHAGKGFQSYSAKPEHSGGFHLFGGGHGSGSSYGRSFGGGRAPKGFGGGKHSGGGGGHSSGHGGWGHHH
ncbi:MAG: DUF3300 domain-containing protein [Terracidiphilus sp.]